MTYELNKMMTKDGITYNSLHHWLRDKYGSANKCEHTSCKRESKFFNWSLKKGKEYEKKRENFWQLCRQCHFLYDLKEYQKQKFSEGTTNAHKTRIGTHHSQESKDKISKNRKGIPAWNKGKEWSIESRNRMSVSAMGRVPWNKGLKLV